VPKPADLPALVEETELRIGHQVLPGRTGRYRCGRHELGHNST
jgi:hypothetical protein